MYDIEQLRKTEFPDSDNHLFFNHAGISPLPVRSQTAVKQAIDGLTTNPNLFFHSIGIGYMEKFYQQAAAHINAHSPEEIVGVSSVSSAINLLAQAIDWQPGDNILFCDIEFPSNAYPWLSLERRGVEVRQVPADNGGLTLNALRPFVDGRTRLIAASAIQFFSGHRTDLTAVGQFCHQHGIRFVVDAIQAIGHMKIDVQAMHIDALATGGQKSLLGLIGQGFMYVRGDWATQLQPPSISGNSTQDYLHWLKYDLTPANGAHRFNTGSPNVPGIIATVESLSLINELGIEQIDQHTRALADRCTAVVSQLGYQVVSPQPAMGPIVTFKIEGGNEAADALHGRLQAQQVNLVKHLDRQGNPYLRVSFHCYNTFDEIEKFGRILAEVGS